MRVKKINKQNKTKQRLIGNTECGRRPSVRKTFREKLQSLWIVFMVTNRFFPPLSIMRSRESSKSRSEREGSST
jgi:hypothetical protein